MKIAPLEPVHVEFSDGGLFMQMTRCLKGYDLNHRRREPTPLRIDMTDPQETT